MYLIRCQKYKIFIKSSSLMIFIILHISSNDKKCESINRKILNCVFIYVFDQMSKV